jgi:hypothetical protein
VRRSFTARRSLAARLAAALGLVLSAQGCLHEPSWPALSIAHTVNAADVAPGATKALATAPVASSDDERIRAQPFCVATIGSSGGVLGETVLYRYRRVGDELRVGYFVYWSSERPWGNNTLTRELFPALAIDAVYSHTLFVLPGLQRALYGAGDIEGVLVRYAAGSAVLRPEQVLADDEGHHRVTLGAEDVLASDGRVIVMSESWSHQLGARDAVRRASPLASRCFSGDSLQPLSADVAARFRLGDAKKPRRARPAWAYGDE